MTAKQESDGDVQELYGLPLAEFTPARDALAKRLRGEGDRQRAEDVKRLRKPTAAAWALNQVRRSDSKPVDELLAAGEALRGAQERLLSGGKPEALREAAAEERRRAEQVVALATRQLAEAGHTVTAALQSKLAATAHAIAGDAEARELLEAGRLVTDYEISDLGLSLVAAGEQTTTRGPRPQRGASKAAEPARPKESARLTRTREALMQARTEQREHDRALASAQQAAEQAAKLAERALRDAELARKRAEEARRSAERGAQRVHELDKQLHKLDPDAG